MTDKVLGPHTLAWLESRQIDAETAARCGLYTGSRTDDGEVVPDAGGNIIVFPYMEHGVEVSAKYRAPGKKFWQRTGGRRTFWNSDILDDPALAEGAAALIITEGEPDAATAIDCGFPFTVSVPDGAPPVPEGEKPDELAPLDAAAEQTGKFEFLWNNRERLKGPRRRFIIAADNDAPGKRLAAELVRRLSASRCAFVTYPEGCKDLNDVRMKHGPEAVARVLNTAQPYPVHGLYRLRDFPNVPPIATVGTGWWTLDRHLKPFAGELMFVLGIPGNGKSALIGNMAVHWAERYGWRTAMFAPEEPTVPHMRGKLRRVRLRGDPLPVDVESIRRADDWIDDHFVFIATDPNGQDDEELYLDWILERATDAVMRYGVQVLVIDPWNEIEHARRKNESGTEYTGRAIRMLNTFRRQYGVMVIVIIHPTKEVGKDGKARPPTPYDADGSAMFYNKADHFVIVHRADKTTNDAMVRVAKSKFEGTGQEGYVNMRFDRSTGWYGMLDGSANDDMRVD